MDAIRQLRGVAERLSVGEPSYSYRLRMQLEGVIFDAAKQFAKSRLSHDLGGFSYRDREELIRLTETEGRQRFRPVLEAAFSLRAFLALLSSGEPYRAGELEDIAGRGSGAPIRMLKSMILRFADLLDDANR